MSEHSTFSTCTYVDKNISRTVGSSSKLFAWFILHTFNNNRLTVGLYHFVIVLSLFEHLSEGNWRWDLSMCTVTSYQSNKKKEAVDFFLCYWQTFAATSCYSIRPYRQVSFNKRKRLKSIHIYRSVPRQLSSLHNYFLAAVAIHARTICVYVHNSYVRSSMPQLLEERERSNETTLNC